MSSDDEPLPLVGDDDLGALPIESAPASAQGSTKIQAFGAAALAGAKQRDFKRPVNVNGAGATRVKVFNTKITLAAVDHMIDQINEWLDSEKVEVKFVNQVVGVVEGKKPEPNLILTVWY